MQKTKTRFERENKNKFCSFTKLLKKKRFWLYVLLLEKGRYYIGRTNRRTRITEHFTPSGVRNCRWLRLYKPIKVIRVFSPRNLMDEDILTKIFMMKKGIKNVRGGSYRTVSLNRDQKRLLLNELILLQNLCFICCRNGHFAKNCPERETNGN